MHIICAGEVMLELANDAGGSDYHLDYAGDSFNTSVYLARAGLAVSYLTRLGDDAYSTAILQRMAGEGISGALVSREKGARPGLYLIENEPDGERHFSYWRDSSPARRLLVEIPELPPCDVFYFTGITLAVTLADFSRLQELLQQLGERGCRVIFDPNYRPRLWSGLTEARAFCEQVLPLCHTVLPTLADDRELWGVQSVEESLALYRRAGCEEVVLKGDDLVAHASIGSQCWSRRAREVAAVDTTGAGDAFNAGYLVARLSGAEPGDALEQAQCLAAQVVRHRGAILPPDGKGD